jgi:hypothetical protein
LVRNETPGADVSFLSRPFFPTSPTAASAMGLS